MVAALLRGLPLLLGLDSLRDDPDAYARLARNWALSGVYGIESADGQHVMPTAFRPPLYPWLLSWLITPTGELPPVRVAGLHWLLGLATVLLTWSVARRLNQPCAWLPALLVAADPLLLRGSQLVMTETLAACLAVLAWRLWLAAVPAGDGRRPPPAGVVDVTAVTVASAAGSGKGSGRGRRQWLAVIGLGGVLGASVLARPTAAPWVVLLLLGWLCDRELAWRQRIARALVIGLLVAAWIAPWMARNAAVLGQPLWATSHGGYTLLLANNPLLYAHFRENGPSRQWDADAFHERWGWRYDRGQSLPPTQEEFWFAPVVPLGDRLWPGELSDDQLAYAAARQTIARQPEMFLLSCVYRLGWLWAWWPHTVAGPARWAIGMWYASVFALAIVGAGRMVRSQGAWSWLRSWWLPLSLLVSLSVVHAVYWSNMRMRAPAMPVIAVAAAAACCRPRPSVP